MNLKPWHIAAGAGLVLGATYTGAWVYKGQTMELEFFSPAEFGPWWPLMDPELLYGLDEFRRQLGRPVVLTRHYGVSGSLGRNGAGESMHNHLRWGMVKAADIMVPGSTKSDLRTLFNVAKGMNRFGGIGVYPDWKPWPGLHLDTRDQDPSSPATWAGIDDAGKQIYVGVSNGWA